MFLQPLRLRTPARAKAAARVGSPGTASEDFWNALADDTEAMSDEELRAELAQFRLWGPRDIH